MDLIAALKIIDEAIIAIDKFDAAYARIRGREGYAFYQAWNESLQIEQVHVLPQLELARQIAMHVGAHELPIADPSDKTGFGSHPFEANRKGLIVLRTRLAEQERMSSILGPTEPQLSTSSLHPTIWEAAARLFDGGHYRQAVQTAGQALESLLQVIAGPVTSGQDLAKLFGTSGDAPRLHFANLDPKGKTYTSAREGAANLIRGAMMGVRNLISHPEWPDPTETEALEMLAVLSYVAHLVEKASKIE